MAPSPLHPRHIACFSSYIGKQAGAPAHWVHCVLLGSLLTTVAVQPGRCRRFIGTLLARIKHAPRTLRMEDKEPGVDISGSVGLDCSQRARRMSAIPPPAASSRGSTARVGTSLASPSSKPRWEASGSTSPLEKQAGFLLALIDLEPDLTLDEVVCAFAKEKVVRCAFSG
jgi:hypothetical protein